jgi:hypothetical protein
MQWSLTAVLAPYVQPLFKREEQPAPAEPTEQTPLPETTAADSDDTPAPAPKANSTQRLTTPLLSPASPSTFWET